MTLESCPLRPTEPEFPIEVRASMQTALTEGEDKFCSLENLLHFFPLNMLMFVLEYRNHLETLLKEFLEEKSP